jgi:hypothetical protein
MSFWTNLVGYQAVWFATVIGAGQGLWWPALASASAFVALQWVFSPLRTADTRLLCIALAAGLCIEGLLEATGWMRHAVPAPALPPGGAPLWILALWAAFAMTLNHSLAYLRGRPWLAALLGVAGAPLAYLSAARGWQAVAFEAPQWRGLALLAAGWALAMPLLAMLAARWARPAPTAPLAQVLP